jgi:Asparagine synthase
MASSRDVDAFVRRLERRVAQEVEGRSRNALAYSGGLASTLLAMIARKRCALVCVVAGVEGSPDLQGARAAKAHLDYRVEYVILNRAEAIRIRTQIVKAHPKLPRSEVDNLVPLHAALETADGGPILSGFGPPRLGAEMITALRRLDVSLPIREVGRGVTLSRTMLRDAAMMLGLPATWARVAHRSPAEGAGIRELF